MQEYTDDITLVYVKERKIWESSYGLKVKSSIIPHRCGFFEVLLLTHRKTKDFNTFCENYNSAPGIPCITLITQHNKMSRQIQNASTYINKSIVMARKNCLHQHSLPRYFSSCLPKTEINTISLTVLSATKMRGCMEYSNWIQVSDIGT